MRKRIDVFPQVCLQEKLPAPVAEHRFHQNRRWRYDYAWPEYRVALEVEGGIWSGGAHGRGTGIARDIEKYNYAAVMGWIVIRCTPGAKLNKVTFAFIRAAIAASRNRFVTSETAPADPPST